MGNGSSVRAFVGTFRRLGGAGIYTVEYDSRTAKFGPVDVAAHALDPTYLVCNAGQQLLYSVGATDLDTRQGLMVAYEYDRETVKLTEVDRRPTSGAAACHVAFSEASGVLVVANYLGGSISAVRIGERGTFGVNVQSIAHRGASVHPQRQAGPHPHSVTFDLAGTRAIACDLGTDQLLQYAVGESLDAPLDTPPRLFECDKGAGPRHLVFHPSGRFAYVVNELSSSVTGFHYTPDEGLAEAFGTWSTLPLGWSGMNLPAAIRLNTSGDRLYVSNRGHDSIATFALNATTGSLNPDSHFLTGGKIPRDFALTPDGSAMVVANEISGSFVALAIDRATGCPGEITDRVDIPGAVSVAFGC